MLFLGYLAGSIFPSWCNVFHGNAFVLVIEDKVARVRFSSRCNVVVFNAVALVLEGKLAHSKFPS